MNDYSRKLTVTGEKATLTTLGAKMEITQILAKAPWRDLIEVLGDVLAGVIFALVPREE